MDNQGYNCPRCNSTVGPFAKECRHCGVAITKQHKSMTVSSPNKINKREINNQPDITYLGEVDSFTKETLVDNYIILSNKLNVSPRVVVHPRGTMFENQFSGFYYSDGVIEIVDDYLLISCLAHEMRHMYQQQYRPDMYYNIHVTNAREYVNCNCEKDARKFSMDYCRERGYLEELGHLVEHEKEYDLFLKGVYSAEDVNLDEEYFRMNPIYPQAISYEQSTQGSFAHSSYSNNTPYNEPRFSIEGSTIVGMIIIATCLFGLYLMLTGKA